MEKEIIWGYLLLTDKELSERINMSLRTTRKHLKTLIEKGYAEEIKLSEGRITRFNLTKLGLANENLE